MTSTLKIVHRTGYTYSSLVSDSLNEIRMTPLYSPQQLIRERSLSISPKPWSRTYIDYWGTHVTEFELHEPHDKLAVKVTTVLDVDPVEFEITDTNISDIEEFVDRWNEYLVLTPTVEPPADFAQRVEEIAAQHDSIDQIGLAVAKLVHEEVAYESGATDVLTDAKATWEHKKGVCQDFSHLLIGGLRHIGIPARYVSGYILPQSDAPLGEPMVGESHAWVQWFNGSWVDYDPTNDCFPGELHAKVGVGREYSDVAPLRGIFVGNAQSEMFVEVEITRIA